MPLDQQQHAKAEAWLNKHLKGKPCPICSQSAWVIHNAVNGLTDITGGVLHTAGHMTMYGVVIFRCSACSYVVLVATHGVGIDVSHKA